MQAGELNLNEWYKPNIDKKTILMPDTKIIVTQVKSNNKVWPMSGW